jgi:excisionase family DNA binding protein
MVLIRPVAPEDGEPREAAAALERVQAYLADHSGPATVRLVGEAGETTAADRPLVVPRSAVALLAEVLAHLADGRPVSVIPADAELTTQQAADMLNVSRPYLVGILDAGEIPHRKVGTRRRVRFQDLLAYQKIDEARRRKAAAELTRLSAELGVDY